MFGLHNFVVVYVLLKSLRRFWLQSQQKSFLLALVGFSSQECSSPPFCLAHSIAVGDKILERTDQHYKKMGPQLDLNGTVGVF